MSETPAACEKCDGKGYVFFMPERSKTAQQVTCRECEGSGIAPWADPRPMKRTPIQPLKGE